jgi:hypothetical protein
MKFHYAHSSFSSVGRRKRSVSTIELKQSRSSSSLSNGKLSLYEDEVFKLTPFVDEGLHTGTKYMKSIFQIKYLRNTYGISGTGTMEIYT